MGRDVQDPTSTFHVKGDGRLMASPVPSSRSSPVPPVSIKFSDQGEVSFSASGSLVLSLRFQCPVRAPHTRHHHPHAHILPMASTNDDYGRDPSIPANEVLAIVSFLAIAFYNVIELNVMLLATFRNRRSLYFWSFVVAIWGIAVWSLGFLLKNFRLTSSSLLYSIFIASGWCAMVTGQSLVLYSRLHLLVYRRAVLRAVLGMIIFNAVTQHIPTMIVGFGANSADPMRWVRVYPYFEKVNVSVFFAQEMVISAIYVIYTTRWLRSDGAVLSQETGKMLRHLIWINLVIVVLDITVLALEFAGHYDMQTAYKGMAYSIKLKLEFQILNDLVRITKASAYNTSRFETGTLVHTTEPAVREVEDAQRDTPREEVQQTRKDLEGRQT
ncbi:hypothetical protein B0T11DRAFT_274408 [Plectosphaerella cucumerina]|uniref:DUF7703 domain-containing protein n=1 Tax=Plectosphaerella cucumerina TaxID=40658 RepID=A0A8K0TH28_9PEZI|nr:hypothetical protein B0T11DRAFT_274408 [Plectosphaerella cucumerina]